MKVLNLVTTSDSAHFQEQIRALEKNGVECEIIATSGSESPIRDFSGSLPDLVPRKGQEFIYYGATALSYYPKVLSESLQSDKYELVHATSGFVAPVGIAQPKRPVVITFWGTDLLGNYWGGKYKSVCRYCARKADATIVMSEEMKRELGCDAHVIPHGIDMEKFSPLPQYKAKRKLNWKEDQRYVLFPYHPDRTVKRYPLAKRVVEQVNTQLDSDVSLIVLTGEAHWKVPLYMNAADVLLLTSEHEGSPNTVKEALACNLPVVATDVGDVEERLIDVSPSTICDSEEELIAALVNILKSYRRSNGRKQIKDLSLEQMGDQILEVYKNAVENT